MPHIQTDRLEGSNATKALYHFNLHLILQKAHKARSLEDLNAIVYISIIQQSPGCNSLHLKEFKKIFESNEISLHLKNVSQL